VIVTLLAHGKKPVDERCASVMTVDNARAKFVLFLYCSLEFYIAAVLLQFHVSLVTLTGCNCQCMNLIKFFAVLYGVLIITYFLIGENFISFALSKTAV
jgi:hypothetical protein